MSSDELDKSLKGDSTFNIFDELESLKGNSDLNTDLYDIDIDFLTDFNNFGGGSHEKIYVRNEGYYNYVFKETIHGPVLSDSFVGAKIPSDLFPDLSQFTLSYAWPAYDNVDMITDGVIGIMYADNLAEFRKATQSIAVLSFGMFAATLDGDIAFQSTGRLPIRNVLGDLPLCGWVSKIRGELYTTRRNALFNKPHQRVYSNS